MENHNNKKEFYKKLATIQQKIKCAKDKTNLHSKFDYRSLENMFDTVKKACIDTNINDIFITIKSNKTNENGKWFIENRLFITDGENEFETPPFAVEINEGGNIKGEQRWGAANTYACKYLIQNTFFVSNGNDDDPDDEVEDKTLQQNNDQKITAEQLNNLNEIIKTIENNKIPLDKNKMLETYKVKSLEDIMQSQYTKIKLILKNKLQAGLNEFNKI